MGVGRRPWLSLPWEGPRWPCCALRWSQLTSELLWVSCGQGALGLVVSCDQLNGGQPSYIPVKTGCSEAGGFPQVQALALLSRG